MEHDRKMLDRAEKLLKRATPGPWKADKNEGCRGIKAGKRGSHRQAQHEQIVYTNGLSDDAEDRANAELIAHVVTNLPRLIQLARRAVAAEDMAQFGRSDFG